MSELKAHIAARYWGCKIVWEYPHEKDTILTAKVNGYSLNDLELNKLTNPQLVLRPLSEITYDDTMRLLDIVGAISSISGFITFHSPNDKIQEAIQNKYFQYNGADFLRSNGYDLDGLIDSGLAIDSTKNKE